MDKQNNINNSIDLFRFICAILVVVIHTMPFAEFGGNMFYFISVVLPRIAVPYFFAISGYFYIGKLLKGTNKFKSYLGRLVIPYLIWSAIYIFCDLVIMITQQDFDFVYLKSIPINILLFGVREHLWFFPAIFINVIIVTIFARFKLLNYLYRFSVLSYLVGCLGSSWIAIGNQIPILQELYTWEYYTIIRRVFLLGLPYFMMGYIINRYSVDKKRKRVFGLVFSAIFFLLEIFIVNLLLAPNDIILTMSLYLLLYNVIQFFLQYKNICSFKIAQRAKILSGFVYFAHPLVIVSIKTIFLQLGINITSTLLFVTVCSVTILSAILLKYINNKWLNYFLY